LEAGDKAFPSVEKNAAIVSPLGCKVLIINDTGCHDYKLVNRFQKLATIIFYF
jgi:hypothetical protein